MSVFLKINRTVENHLNYQLELLDEVLVAVITITGFLEFWLHFLTCLARQYCILNQGLSKDNNLGNNLFPPANEYKSPTKGPNGKKLLS